jgi:hypothetical protein
LGHFHTTCRLAGSTLLGLFLMACGGGGSSDGNGPSVPLDTVRITCNVIDSVSGAAVAGARFTFQSGTSEFSAVTDANGNCELLLPSAQVAGTVFPAASVEKEGYEPQTVLYRELQAGTNNSQQVRLVPLAENVSIPLGGGIVYHLGDDQFEGSVNSQFQKASDGTELAFVIEDWAQKVRAGYTRATVYVDAKGWQSSQCGNVVALSGDAGTVSLPGGNSAPDGSWSGGTQVPFVFSIAQVGTQRAEVRFNAGVCPGAVLDFDDFEINRLRVYFD